MADTTRDQDQMDELNSDRTPSEDGETEREGNTPEINRDHDESERGKESGPTDPDSAESDVDRDDTVSD